MSPLLAIYQLAPVSSQGLTSLYTVTWKGSWQRGTSQYQLAYKYSLASTTSAQYGMDERSKRMRGRMTPVELTFMPDSVP